jgi:uncharacterized protein with NAD-binding domain and iron-sulfur cluster
MTSVAVLGGGVGGLSAAHELGQRGFDVTVYEMREDFGGKARSMPVPGSGTDGRHDLPGEHGFRFFPGFYRHVTDTMSRIPHQHGTVYDHLVPAKRILLAQDGRQNELIAPAEFPTSINDLALAAKFIWDFGTQLRLPSRDLAFFMGRLFTLLTSCDERRYEQWERLSWWEFTAAQQRSENFQKFLADGLTRTLVAAKARQMSARTGGLILCQLLFDMMRVGGRVDRVLDGPTSEVWIAPWIAYLERFNVTLRGGCKITGIDCDGQKITGVTVNSGGATERVVADYYLSALPVECLRRLLTPELCGGEPRLEKLERLLVRWMNGVMFYLERDVPLQRGHTIFIDSPWALTAISQAQFWPTFDLEKRGNGEVNGILSIDVSEWEREGKYIKKKAIDCSKPEIYDEVWHQVVDAIDDGSLNKRNIVCSFLDPAVQTPNPQTATDEAINLEPLLVNTRGSWDDRPDAVTNIPNFFLAADFVRTNTDLATMEGANEAARRAVNGILEAAGSTASRCAVWKLREPAVFAPLRVLDQIRWRLAQPLRAARRVKPLPTPAPTRLAARPVPSDRRPATV